MLAPEQALQVHVMERVFDAGEGLLGLAGGVAVALGRQLEVEAGFFERFLLLAPGDQRGVQQGALAQDALRRFAVVPEVGYRRLGVELLDARLPSREVKDTSRTPPGVARGKRSGPSVR
jgi:hypothetical protein